MAVKSITCWLVECDECGTNLTCEDNEDGEWSPHFDDAEHAGRHLYGDPNVERDDDANVWPPLLDGQRLDDGRILCGQCNAKRLLAERGHNWMPWKQCNCYDPVERRRLVNHHEATGRCPEYRYCQRRFCPAREEREPAAATA